MNQLLEAALSYANIGWHIFPLVPKQKVPLTEHGVKDATVDTIQIREWWSKWPNANIGLACGEKSGVYIIDVDVDLEKGINGLESLKEFPPLPETVKQFTPRGGFHAFFKTNNPPANRNSFRPGLDIRGSGYYVVLAPSVHPNGGRYCWCDSCLSGDIVLAEYPDFMRPVTRAPWACSAMAKDATSVSVPAPLDILQRASLYLAQCDPAIQGQAGHDKLLWAATALVHGFQLSDNQSYDLLTREYNPRCVPPWDLSNKKDQKDFERKISEARKLTPQHQKGWLLNERTTCDSLCTIDIDKLVSNQNTITHCGKSTIYSSTVDPTASIAHRLCSTRKYELDFLCQPTGLLGEICSWINSTSLKAQPFLSLACTLAFLGALFGRKIKDQLGSRTNLYCMGVAQSSAGKAHAMNQIRKICMEAGIIEILGGDDIASDAAIEERMSRVESTLFLWDEIGHLLTHIKSGASKHLSQVVSLLMKLYSAAGSSYCGKEYAEQGKQRTIIQPCCCIYGTSTLERFATGITQAELQDGWLSRCLVFHSPENPIKCRDRPDSTVPKSIIDQVQKWYHRQIGPENDGHTLDPFISPSYTKPIPQQIIVSTDNEAEKIFIECDNESIKYGKEQPALNCLWGKAEENARRIALIIAAGERYTDLRISSANADYACRLNKYLLIDFEKKIVPEIVAGELDSRKRKLVSIIEKKGEKGCGKRDLTRNSQWTNQKQRNDLISDLIEAGEIEQQLDKAGHLKYWTTEYFLKLEKK